MIRGYSPTLSSIYIDPAFQDWSATTLHFYRYLYENDHADELSGIGQIREEVMRVEAKIPAGEISEARRVIGDKVYWLGDGIYWVKARAKYACYRNGATLIKSRAAQVRKLVKTLPDDLCAAFTSKYPDLMAAPARSTKPRTSPVPSSAQDGVPPNASPSAPPKVSVNPPPFSPAASQPVAPAPAPIAQPGPARPWSLHGPRPHETKEDGSLSSTLFCPKDWPLTATGFQSISARRGGR
jgi:hypothetical protein